MAITERTLLQELRSAEMLDSLRKRFPSLELFRVRLCLVENPLLLAVILNDHKEIERLVETHPIDPKDDVSALQVAVVMNNLPLVKFFLNRGANINRTCYPDKTALHFAVEAENAEMVKFLLDQKDIDINYQGRGPSALRLAIEAGPCESSMLIIHSEKLNTFFANVRFFEHNGLFSAITKKDLTILKALLNKGCIRYWQQTYYLRHSWGIDSIDRHKLEQWHGYNKQYHSIWISPAEYANLIGFEAGEKLINEAEKTSIQKEKALIHTYLKAKKELASEFPFFQIQPLQEIVLSYLQLNTFERDVSEIYKEIGNEEIEFEIDLDLEEGIKLLEDAGDFSFSQNAKGRPK